MPDRSGPLDIKLAGLPFKILQTPGARPGLPAKAEYVCKEVEQIRDHFGGGTEPNYGDYPTSVESVYYWDDWSNGLSPTRQQRIDKTYWTSTGVDARRVGQLVAGPLAETFTTWSSGARTIPIVKMLDFGSFFYVASGGQLFRLVANVLTLVLDFAGTTDMVITDLVVFNGVLLASAKSSTPTIDGNSGGTVTYGASTLIDTAKAWTVNAWANRLVFAGGQINVVLSNTATTLTMVNPWASTPGAGSAYTIDPYAAYKWSANGTSWSTFDPRSGANDAGRVDKFAAVRFQLWKSVLPNSVYSCLDPTAVASNARSWTSTPTLIGDTSRNITSLSAYITDLAIGKEDGLWSLDRNGNDFPILPELAAVAAATNVRNLRQWRNGLVFPVRNGFFRYEGSKMESIGLDRYRAAGAVGAPLAFQLVDSAPYLNELFASLNNISSTSSPGACLGVLLPDPWRWHLIASFGSGVTLGAMAISLNVPFNGGATGTPILMVAAQSAFSTAVAAYHLPAFTDNPLDDSGYVYASPVALVSTEISPLPDQDKVFEVVRVRASANNLTLGTTVSLEYAIDADIDSQTFTSMLGAQGQTLLTVPGTPTLLEFFFPKPVVGKSIQFRLTLGQYGVGTIADTAVVKHCVVHYKHAPQPRKRWEIGLLCEDQTLGEQSYQDPRTAGAQVASLLGMRRDPRTPKTFEDRLGVVWSVFVERVDHELLEKLPGLGDRWLCKVTLLESVGTATPVLQPAPAP